MAPSKPNKDSNFLAAIKKFISISNVTLHLDGDSSVTLPRGRKKYSFNSTDKILTVYVNNLSEKDSTDIVPIINSYFEKYGLALDTEQEQIVEAYEGYNNTNHYKEALDLFKNKITEEDYYALQMSFFMKIEKANGEDIELYKLQIKERYGKRGAYIANLCYAGFYEDEFRKKVLKLSKDQFDAYYELRVGKELAALFVHSGLTPRSLLTLFTEKVNLCLLYKVKSFRILGMGQINVGLIEWLLKEIEDIDFGINITNKTIIETTGGAAAILEKDIILDM